MHRAVVAAYALLIAGGFLGYQAAQYRVNIRRLHNTFAALMLLVVGLGLVKHTKKLMVNERDVLAWVISAGFRGSSCSAGGFWSRTNASGKKNQTMAR